VGEKLSPLVVLHVCIKQETPKYCVALASLFATVCSACVCGSARRCIAKASGQLRCSGQLQSVFAGRTTMSHIPQDNGALAP